MKKKVFSLMMMLLLAFIGVAKAEVVTIGEGTTTYYYYPVNMYFNYSLTEELYTPDEIGTAGTINAISFYYDYSSSFSMSNVTLYMKNVTRESFASNTDMEPLTTGDIVWNGTFSASAAGWVTITLDTPFEYDGTSNLLVAAFDGTSGYPGSSFKFRTTTCTGYKGIHWYSDSYTPDPYNTASGFSGSKSYTQYRANIQLDITAGGGSGSMEDQLHVKYMNADGEEVIDSLNLGVRPANAWMAPFEFTMYSEGPNYTVNVLDFTPSDGMFTVEGEELPFHVRPAQDVELTMGTNATEAGIVERQFVAITEGNRAAHIWPVVVEMYTPECPDVVEVAYDFGTIAPGFTYDDDPAEITSTTLHNDYTLPFPEIEEGEDAVYKFTVEEDVILNAHVNEDADNGKVALYKQEGEELPHPMADNNYTGLTLGSSAASMPFEVQIGEGTSTSGYMPFYCFYNYSISQQLFLAAELEEAGVTSAPMTSLSWYCTASNGNQQSNITIWMANVDATAITSPSTMTANMSKVYTGNMTPAANQWNEFVFNEGTFAWDGTSSILISVQRNNGAWASGINWQCSAQSFTASGYSYNDNVGAYNMETNTYVFGTNGSSYGGTTTNRANIIMKAAGGRANTAEPTMAGVSAGPVIENLPLTPGTYYLVASAKLSDDLTGGGAGMGNDDGNRDLDHYTVYINVDEMPCPAIDAEGFAFNPEPADDADEIEPNSVTLRWQVPEYATGWRLIFGSTYYPDPNHPQTIMYPEDGSFTDHTMANSFTVRNLWNNTNYFWHVEFNNDACPDGVSSPTWGFTTHLNVPQNLTAVDETVFNDETVVLNWNAVVDRTYRMYNVYRDGELIGHTTVNNISNTTYTDGPLAYNMNGYVYYVTAVYDEGESAPSNTVTVKVSGYGDVNGHVYEQDGTTGIAGATVTMVGRDEFNVNHTYNFTTNAQGYYSGHIYASNDNGFDGQAAKAGYQTAYEPVQGEPIMIDYNQTTSPIDYILDENFDPVCQVIAEYYPDSLDPNSPYVKVYWGCGLPGSEIIEDFETGDFSLFDWQLDPTYPWSITTYQPYEGTYCMKSGGAGVANVVSNMSVTVDIPADGIMSFFGKISSENNWDYGYFYIDGVQKGSYTGAGSWGEKKFDITSGTHTFKWSYTKDGSVNSNDDCFYVDYITFYKQPEPAQPGWHTWCESEFNNAVGSSLTTTPSWAYEYPASFLHSNYAGWNITKVSLFSDNMYSAVGGNYTCRIYVGGSEPAAGTMVSTITVDVPSNQNAWVDWDLTSPVNVTGNDPIWVVWTANSTVSNWPAGCCGDLNDLGTWWDGGSGWEHLTYGTWTMRHWFTNRSGRSVAVGAVADVAPVAVVDNNPINSSLRTFVKGDNSSNAVCANPNAVQGARLVNNATRSLNHYRVYRTNCYNDGPFTEENTVLLATVWVPDTVYIDVEWADLPAGVYKWGVGAVYEGNRGEMIEAPINWAAPVAITRDATADNDPNPVAGEEGIRAPWDLMMTFEAAEGGHYGVAYDGNNFYTSNWGYSGCTNNFYKYDLEGNMIEGFNISGCGTLRGMTYDGQYFYGVANSSTVYCVDLANHSVVSTFTSAYGAQRGITYDPQRDGFWVIGNWSGNLTLIDRTGAIQLVGPAPTSASDLAYYEDEDGVEHVYCFNNADGGVYDYNITTNTMGGSVFNFGSTPGASTTSSGGCTVAEFNGKMAFIGDLQQSPNLIGVYELHEANVGPNPGPTPGNNLNWLALPRESETVWSNCLDKDMYLGENELDVTVLLNSADSPEGATISFLNYNEAEQEMYPMDAVELDETGFYAWDTFRKGEYQVTVEKDGYETIIDSVSIWDATSLRYVMIEIIYGVSDLYVSSTGWAMWGPMGAAGGQGGQGGGTASTFSVDFENSQMPEGWTTIDANNDGYNWVLGSQIGGVYLVAGASLAGSGHNASNDLICSGSYSNYTGSAITPDNYLVSPQVNLVNGSTFSFWACAQDASYAAEHFGVFVSDNGTSDWTEVQSWTMTAKGEGMMSIGRDGQTRAQGNWYQKTVDLSAFAGQKYIAIRHFNCNDQFILDVDDIELTAAAKDGERHLEHYKVMCTSIDGEPIFNANTPADQPFCQVATDELEEGEHYICKVAAVYSTGMSAWTEVEWHYIPCENYAGTVNGITVEGNTVTWDYPGSGTGPTPPGQGDTFSVNFDDSQMPAGWTTIDANNDGYDWVLGSQIGGIYLVAGASLEGSGHNGSTDLICSGSYSNYTGSAITPDNYLVSPQVTLVNGSTFSFWACAQDASYAAEHFGVFVSDNGTSDWTEVQSWTMTAKGSGVMSIGRDGQTRAQGNWYQKTVDLSAFAGQKYIAIRHFNCNDQFILDVDDIELAINAKGGRADWTFANGFVTDPGAMSNGGDASWIKGSQSTYGPGCQQSSGNRVGDSFTVDATTTIDEITVYGYQTGSSTTSTFNGLYVQIYDGNPMNGGNVVWGDANANIMSATAFTGAYRGSDGDATGTTRPIMSVTASGLNIELEAGTYWLVYQLNGTGSSGPWAQPHAEPGIGNTGNGVQWLGSNNAWQNLSDSGSGTPYGVAMTLHGTQGGQVGPTPSGDILGAMIFVDGEWEAFVEVPTNTYTYEGDGNEICVRMVYNGTNTLPDGNIYFSMSCEECDFINGQSTCEPGAPIHAEVLNATDQVKIWWGEMPAPPMEEWLYYDDGEMQGAVGAGGTVYWGIMLPANSLAAYAGTSLTKVAVMEYTSAGNYTANIYLGGTSAPGTLVSTKTFSCTGTSDWKEVELDTYVPVDGTQNLWITMYQSGITYPATGSNDTGDANGRWVSVDGNTWYDIIDASSGSIDYTWMIRGFVTNQAKGGEVVALPDFQGNVGGELSSVVTEPTAPAFPMNRSEIVLYNVYRSEDNVEYELIGSVEEDGSGYYEFIDTPETAGTYYYQVKALYDNGCESEGAPAFDNPDQDYVTAFVDAIGENDGNVAIYPNPTKGNVTIEAAGMSRITVMSVLGQVVFDTELNANNYTLNMAQFNAGMYVVRVYSESGVSVKRITVVE